MIDFIDKRIDKWKRSVRKRVAIRRLERIPQNAPKNCVIVASNGRSGSTLTFLALAEALKEVDPVSANKVDFVARLSDTEFYAPCVYKTHDFPQPLSTWPENTRVVFCFGPTKDSAFSVFSAKERYGADWIDQHFYHLHATGTFDELFERDVLQQAKQIKEWITFEDVPVLCVRYDALWDHQETISRFTGLEFTPPKRRERTPKDIPEEFKTSADRLYDPIDEVIDQLPECFIASAQYKSVVDKLPVTD
ncbi:SseB family protein [Ruegeria arenilitoris]|uniref:SseB family protein n=1 Tax=Ruegeria arenilitoris TaxID=1173585 RepID=UPI00147BF1AC|nr:SseB family protein [Ruegeria arenilitoris]